MIYTREMRKAVHSIKVPVDGFRMDIVEYPYQPAFITLQFYWTQWNTYTEFERAKLLAYLGRIKDIIEAQGVRVALDPIMDKK